MEARDKSLTVVVVHDDRLGISEESEVVPQKEPSSFASRPSAEPVGAFPLPDGKRLVADRAKPHERETSLEEDLRRFEIDVLPFVLWWTMTGVDRFFRMRIQKIELVAKLCSCYPMLDASGHEYHRDQIELPELTYVPDLSMNIPRSDKCIAPRYRNGGEYPRRRVPQDLFDQSVAEYYKACEPCDNRQFRPTRNRDLVAIRRRPCPR